MPSILDIAPLTTKVTLRGVTFDVRAITIAEVAQLFHAHVKPGQIEKLKGEVDVRDVIAQLGPEMLTAIIALALDQPEADVRTARLSAGEELQVLAAAVDLSIPKDENLGEAMARLRGLIGSAALAKPGLA